MKKIIFIILSFITFQGCLTFHRIYYELNLEGDLNGKGVINIYDIRSGAENNSDFEEDKNSLFDYILKSDEFITDMHNEGKDIVSRRLYVKDDALNGEVKLNFNDIRKIEGIAFEDGFYYLTLQPDDSIYSTNGKVIYSKDYKRIVWDKSIKTLIFEMMASDYDEGTYKELAPYYKEE
jgi:hypothetical protein